MTLNLGCLCGAIRIQFEESALINVKCDCRACKIVTGGANPIDAIFRVKDLKLFDEHKMMRHMITGIKDEEPVQLWYCELCSMPLFEAAPKTGLVFVSTGRNGASSDAAKFKQTWCPIKEGVPGEKVTNVFDVIYKRPTKKNMWNQDHFDPDPDDFDEDDFDEDDFDEDDFDEDDLLDEDEDEDEDEEEDEDEDGDK